MGLGKMGLGELGLGEMGLGEMGADEHAAEQLRRRQWRRRSSKKRRRCSISADGADVVFTETPWGLLQFSPFSMTKQFFVIGILLKESVIKQALNTYKITANAICQQCHTEWVVESEIMDRMQPPNSA